MIALNPIKKDELSHTEPKLWNRRRQIETPTVFNNVEEIPDSIEKFSVLFLRPQKLLVWIWTVEGTLAMRNPALTRHTRWDLFRSPKSQNLLTNSHLWHRHGLRSLENTGHFSSVRWGTLLPPTRAPLHAHTEGGQTQALPFFHSICTRYCIK